MELAAWGYEGCLLWPGPTDSMSVLVLGLQTNFSTDTVEIGQTTLHKLALAGAMEWREALGGLLLKLSTIW